VLNLKQGTPGYSGESSIIGKASTAGTLSNIRTDTISGIEYWFGYSILGKYIPIDDNALDQKLLLIIDKHEDTQIQSFPLIPPS